VAEVIGAKASLLFVIDKITKNKFLIDTGAEVSVLPPSYTDLHIGPKRFSLVAANGTPIPSFGHR